MPPEVGAYGPAAHPHAFPHQPPYLQPHQQPRGPEWYPEQQLHHYPPEAPHLQQHFGHPHHMAHPLDQQAMLPGGSAGFAGGYLGAAGVLAGGQRYGHY
jgi:hypothetical protein